MNSSQRIEELRRTLEVLTDHRRRAAAVAALLAHCEGGDLEEALLSEVGGVFVHEMDGIRECTEILHREIAR